MSGSRTSQSLQSISPYTFPLRTAQHFLHSVASREATTAESKACPDLYSTDLANDWVHAAISNAPLSLPLVHFLVCAGFRTHDAHLGPHHGHQAVDELESAEFEHDAAPIRDYKMWRRVDANITYGTGVPRPIANASDEEYD